MNLEMSCETLTVLRVHSPGRSKTEINTLRHPQDAFHMHKTTIQRGIGMLQK